MGPSGSTLKCHPGAGRAGLRHLAARVLGGTPPAREELAALLFPMVARAVRTERGPVALVRWLAQRAGTVRPGRGTGPRAEHAARRLTEDLVRVLFDPPGALADTLDDS